MHHAYPRECPFPHVAGTVKPITPDEWISTYGSMEVTDSEIMQHNQTHHDVVTQGATMDTLPWTMVEELVAVHIDDEIKQRSSVWSVMRPVMAMVAIVSLLSPLVKAWKGASDKVDHNVDRLLV